MKITLSTPLRPGHRIRMTVNIRGTHPAILEITDRLRNNYYRCKIVHPKSLTWQTIAYSPHTMVARGATLCLCGKKGAPE